MEGSIERKASAGRRRRETTKAASMAPKSMPPGTRSVLEQAKEAGTIADEAFAAGDVVTGIAAISLAAQLIQLAKLQGAA